MTWPEVIYEYDGSFDGFLCCIYESYTKKELPAAFFRFGELQPSLYTVRSVPTDAAHARRVYEGFRRFSPRVGPFLYRAFLTCLADRELAIYRFAAKLYREGAPLLLRLHDETYAPLRRAVRHLNGELELYRGFVRFSDLDGVLAGEIEPKNRVLPLLRGHFCRRCHDETFFLYDRTHREALFYSGGRSAIVPLEDFQMAPPDESERAYRRLWRCFYDTVAIRERENPKLRMTHMPKRYWAMMTEFQTETDAIPPSPAPRAAVAAPDAPGATPAPAIRPGPARSAPASGP